MGNKFTIDETIKTIVSGRLCVAKITDLPDLKYRKYRAVLTHHSDGRPFINRRTVLLGEKEIFKTDFKP
jgi:hypothetical protein